MATKNENAERLITEVEEMYNPNIHGWAYKAEIDFTVRKMREVMQIFTSCNCDNCDSGIIHDSDCTVHNEPMSKNTNCNCGVANAR